MSFIKMKNKGRNGRKVGKNGQTRNRITKEEFAKCAIECNGDIEKMSQKSNLNQPKAAVKQRYENLTQKGFQYHGKSLPPMIYNSNRSRVTIDNQKLVKLAKLWNKSGGDAELVAEKIGCSVATVLAKIRQLDNIYEEQYKKRLMQEFELSEEDAIKQIEEGDVIEDLQAGFESPLCERKTKQRGREGIQLDASIVNSITEMLEDVEVPEENDEFDVDSIVNELFKDGE